MSSYFTISSSINYFLAIPKAIWSDDTGAMLLTRQLKNGRFAKLVARAQEGTSLLVSPQELEEFFSGKAIQHTPRSLF